MRRLPDRPGLVFALVFAWKVALLIFTAQPVPANDSFFYDGAVVNFLLHGKYANPSLALVLPISGNAVFCAYPPLYQVALLGWMSISGTSALSAMWLHVFLFGVYELIVLAIFRWLRTPAPCVNVAGLFLLSITFHDRPDSLAHVFGMAAVYACVRARSSLGAQPQINRVSFWTWALVLFTVLTLGTSLQIGAFYLLFIWLALLAGRMFAQERLPIAAMTASVLIPIGLIGFVALGFPHLWAGFLEHTRLTPSATGLRIPDVSSILKIIRTVPGVLAVSVLLPWLVLKRNGRGPADDKQFWLMAGACTATAVGVVIASLSVVTANMVQIANYLQPLAVGACLALVITRTDANEGLFRSSEQPRAGLESQTKLVTTTARGGATLPRRCLAIFLALAFIVSIRAIGMSTWGVACANDMDYATALDRLRTELNATAPGNTVLISAAYLYETARHDNLNWIHSDWPGKPDYSRGDWERDALLALKPAKLIITQFDYYRRYEAVLGGLRTRPELVEIKIENTIKVPAPDSMKRLQKVVQHISWAPVVVEFSWR